MAYTSTTVVGVSSFSYHLLNRNIFTTAFMSHLKAILDVKWCVCVLFVRAVVLYIIVL